MRAKILFLVMAILLLNNVACAYDLLQKYVVSNDTPNIAVTQVSTSTIIPGVHEIVGVSVIPMQKSSGGVCTELYDAADLGGLTETNLFGESETLSYYSLDSFYPYPKNISSQLTIRQTEYSVVIVYYTR